MNILILSCGTRNKIVQYFRKTLKGRGRVVCTDCSAYAPALYEADQYYIVPRMSEEGYLEAVFAICRKEKIKGVLSLIDPELSLLAKHQKEFGTIGTTVVGSSFDLCEMSLDKYEMFQWLKDHGYECAKSYVKKEEFDEDIRTGKIHFPVFVKPVRGSASLAVSKVFNQETVDLLFQQNDELMVQEFLSGKEIGADVYIDMISGDIISIFLKKKIKMRAGETDKAVSFKDQMLFSLIEKFVKETGYKGQIDIDIFDIEGKYYISEVNPRFGGGYPHAHECGADHVKLIVNNLEGIINEPIIGNYEEGVSMMKYNEISIRRIYS